MSINLSIRDRNLVPTLLLLTSKHPCFSEWAFRNTSNAISLDHFALFDTLFQKLIDLYPFLVNSFFHRVLFDFLYICLINGWPFKLQLIFQYFQSFCLSFMKQSLMQSFLLFLSHMHILIGCEWINFFKSHVILLFFEFLYNHPSSIKVSRRKLSNLWSFDFLIISLCLNLFVDFMRRGLTHI